MVTLLIIWKKSSTLINILYPLPHKIIFFSNHCFFHVLVSLMSSFFKRKDGHTTSSNPGNDTQLDTFRTSVQLREVNSPSVDESRLINSGRCTSSPSVYTYNSENELYDEDQASVVIDEDLRNYMREVNQFQTYDDGRCPVHG